MAETKERVKLTTPALKCIWPKLKEPQMDFKGVHMEYSVSLTLTPEELEALPFKAQLDDMVADKVKEVKATPLPPDLKKKIYAANWYKEQTKGKKHDYEPTGLMELKFKTRADINDKTTGEPKRVKIPVYDAAKVRLDPIPEIGNDSVIKVAFTPISYFAEASGEVGITLYLSAVQLIELVEYMGADADASAYGFGEETGGYVAPAKPKTISDMDMKMARTQAAIAKVPDSAFQTMLEEFGVMELKDIPAESVQDFIAHVKAYKAETIDEGDVPF